MSSEVKVTTLKGDRQDWNLTADAKNARTYIVQNMNYGLARKLFQPHMFSATTGEGEQRAPKKARINQLTKAILDGTYTPTFWYGSVTEKHVVKVDNKKRVSIDVSPDNPLALTDANHRRLSLEDLRLTSTEMQRLVDNLPIPFMINLDANYRRPDFIHLQDRSPIDNSQLLTMKIHNDKLPDKQRDGFVTAFEIAKILNDDVNSFLFHTIAFDTQSIAPIKFSTLSNSRMSELAFSLYGSALIAKDVELSPEEMAAVIIRGYTWLKEDAPDLLANGSAICPPPYGKYFTTSLLLGLTNLLAYRLKLLEKSSLSETDRKHFVHTCHMIFDGETQPDKVKKTWKQEYLEKFAAEYFQDVLEDSDCYGGHQGVPIPLCLLLGTSSFNLSKIANPPKRRGRKPKNSEPEIPVEDRLEEPELEKEDSDTDPKFLEDESENPIF